MSEDSHPIISIMYFVYIIQSLKDQTYYIGYTGKEVNNRIKEHNQGKCKYTKGHRPYRLVKYINIETKKEAKEMETYFKNLKNSKTVIEIMGSPDSLNRD